MPPHFGCWTVFASPPPRVRITIETVPPLVLIAACAYGIFGRWSKRGTLFRVAPTDPPIVDIHTTTSLVIITDHERGGEEK